MSVEAVPRMHIRIACCTFMTSWRKLNLRSFEFWIYETVRTAAAAAAKMR
ncbi:MAG: hypothetical protein ACKESB_01405 [Candidatus Hodgkinia cicadicola]